MIETFFTSDHHFGHRNILEYEKEARPFNTVEEMNEKLVDNWNKTIGVKDVVYHLGDFAFGRHNVRIAGRLNGRKKLVLGNHDNYPSALYLDYFDKLYGCVFWERCVLSHMPVHPNGLGARWMLNVHGHLHSKQVYSPGFRLVSHGSETEPAVMEKIPDPNYFNVSVEQNNLTPIHRDVIMARLKELD